MKRLFLHSLVICISLNFLFGKISAQQKVFTNDIDNFWNAFDSAKTTNDSARQVQYLQTLYIDKGTVGLKAFMEARNYSAPLYVQLINKYPRFWVSIRPNTLTAKSKGKEIEKSIKKFQLLYPELKNAKMYFTIGGLRSGGTTRDSMVLIGAEIATGDPSTDVSEFPTKWLASVFKEQRSENIISLNIHEYVHTQQKGDANNLLAQAITEGSCDFIAELVIGSPLKTNYILYGKEHEIELKEKFKEEMFSTAYQRWLYNGSNTKTVADLGYFIGYDICKSYYANSSDKKKAVKEIIELNYSDSNAVEAFFTKSKFYAEPIDKEKLMQSFEENQPTLLKVEPLTNGDSTVDASIKEMVFVFSKAMDKGYSINFSERGKDF